MVRATPMLRGNGCCSFLFGLLYVILLGFLLLLKKNGQHAEGFFFPARLMYAPRPGGDDLVVILRDICPLDELRQDVKLCVRGILNGLDDRFVKRASYCRFCFHVMSECWIALIPS